MSKAAAGFLWVLFTLDTVSAQQGTSTRALPNWLTGIIAVVVFLFLVFIAFLVNRAWCSKPSQESKAEWVKTSDYPMANGTQYDTSLDAVRTSDHENAYENVAIKHTVDTVTVM
ncbi:hypothetical protein AAFF_G00032390 [Aldrovandia affinis]|uniref:PDZK1-interacting protein 1 n=1 Tax=Aldrovandia affinis TaxID=143900 RepID=A0AAD7WG97_9TELE|nr:hypothetical protein AAFF_G00032390 [Aldrovandia affinis]